MKAINIKDPVIIYGADDRSRFATAMDTGRRIAGKKGAGQIKLLSSIEFTHRMIDAIRTDKLTKFRKTFRGIGVLIIRDIENMAGKERTQEEMVEIFRSLFLEGKQIILTLYEDPRKVKGFFPPLRSFLKMAKQYSLSNMN